MKVLFVSSGRKGVVGEVVQNQGESLKKAGIELDYFLVKPGLLGHILSVPKIRKIFKIGKYDLIHAHYSLSAFVATLSGRFPVVVSLMGSDVLKSSLTRIISRFLARNNWAKLIVKSKQMKEMLNFSSAIIIPNGVNISLFRYIPKKEARILVEYSDCKKLIVFISQPGRPEKNYSLASKSLKLMGDPDIELLQLYNISSLEVCHWLNAADLLLLTSLHEGSPNIIKEAMACNCPIVSTDVGDVRWIIGNTSGCYISSFEPKDIKEKIELAIRFRREQGYTKGRERIIKLGLDSDTIAKRIVEVYQTVLKVKN